MPDRRQNNDHDLIIRLDEKVDGLTKKLDDHLNNNAALVEDHEKRLRFIERYVWGAIGIIGLMNFIGFAYLISRHNH
jgi:hypothetical protein